MIHYHPTAEPHAALIHWCIWCRRHYCSACETHDCDADYVPSMEQPIWSTTTIPSEGPVFR
jgi:hypothetical protein